MVPNEDKEKFLETLETLPIVSVACKRAGINKATIYRWLESDPVFKRKYDIALGHGRESLVDHAESKLLKLVDKEHFLAIRLVLESNSDRYWKPRKARQAPPVQRIFKTIEYRIVDGRREKVEKPTDPPTPP